MMTPAFVEFVGTTFAVGALAFAGPIAFLGALALAIAWGGSVSGGHFNPAITVYTWMMGKMSQSRAMWYVAAQVAGGVLVALLRR